MPSSTSAASTCASSLRPTESSRRRWSNRPRALRGGLSATEARPAMQEAEHDLVRGWALMRRRSREPDPEDQAGQGGESPGGAGVVRSLGWLRVAVRPRRGTRGTGTCAPQQNRPLLSVRYGECSLSSRWNSAAVRLAVTSRGRRARGRDPASTRSHRPTRHRRRPRSSARRAVAPERRPLRWFRGGDRRSRPGRTNLPLPRLRRLRCGFGGPSGGGAASHCGVVGGSVLLNGTRADAASASLLQRRALRRHAPGW